MRFKIISSLSIQLMDDYSKSVLVPLRCAAEEVRPEVSHFLRIWSSLEFKPDASTGVETSKKYGWPINPSDPVDPQYFNFVRNRDDSWYTFIFELCYSLLSNRMIPRGEIKPSHWIWGQRRIVGGFNAPIDIDTLPKSEQNLYKIWPDRCYLVQRSFKIILSHLAQKIDPKQLETLTPADAVRPFWVKWGQVLPLKRAEVLEQIRQKVSPNGVCIYMVEPCQDNWAILEYRMGIQEVLLEFELDTCIVNGGYHATQWQYTQIWSRYVKPEGSQSEPAFSSSSSEEIPIETLSRQYESGKAEGMALIGSLLQIPGLESGASTHTQRQLLRYSSQNLNRLYKQAQKGNRAIDRKSWYESAYEQVLLLLGLQNNPYSRKDHLKIERFLSPKLKEMNPKLSVYHSGLEAFSSILTALLKRYKGACHIVYTSGFFFQNIVFLRKVKNHYPEIKCSLLEEENGEYRINVKASEDAIDIVLTESYPSFENKMRKINHNSLSIIQKALDKEGLSLAADAVLVLDTTLTPLCDEKQEDWVSEWCEGQTGAAVLFRSLSKFGDGGYCKVSAGMALSYVKSPKWANIGIELNESVGEYEFVFQVVTHSLCTSARLLSEYQHKQIQTAAAVMRAWALEVKGRKQGEGPLKLYRPMEWETTFISIMLPHELALTHRDFVGDLVIQKAAIHGVDVILRRSFGFNTVSIDPIWMIRLHIPNLSDAEILGLAKALADVTGITETALRQKRGLQTEREATVVEVQAEEGSKSSDSGDSEPEGEDQVGMYL